MSYEGHTQNICERGHYFEDDAHEEEPLCTCGAAAVFTNQVDDTNCDAYGLIPVEEVAKLKIADRVTETCPCCAHEKVIERERYRVPSREEQKAMQHRWDHEKWEFVRLA